MKNTIIPIIGLMLAAPFAANAATFVVAPHAGSYSVGDTITLTVSVDPTGGSALYTSMLDARFSPDTLQVESFTLNDALLPLKEPGYDAIDNAAGILTKTGGYTGGIQSVSPFGTIVLRAKSAGTGTFSVGSGSMLLAANGSNQFTGAQSLSFTITPAAPASAAPAVPAATKLSSLNPERSASAGTVLATTSAATSTTAAIPDQLASVAAFVLSHALILWTLGILGILLGGSLFLNRRKSRVAEKEAGK